ncbi:MAG: type III pantothenate kinase [Tannerellaceae bacterium]|nr:type III pantothenate kinase [Tannerellaceae bacterium]
MEQGNTYTKVAVYGKESFVTSFVYKKFDIIVVADLMKEFSFTNGILSTVINKDETLINFLEDYLDFFLVLDETTPLPIQVRYDTPGTLGKDRVAAAVGAHFLQPGKDLLVIDAGTAITYEVIEAPGIYIGGNISPGMTTRFKALNHFTEKLPLVVEKEEISFIGHSTETAIQAGVVNGIIYEMEGYINDLRLKYPDLLVFLTGGHSFYFERRLKNSIFADINLVMTGLNRILEYNVEN